MEDQKNLIGKSFLRNAYFGYGAQVLRIGLGLAWVTVLTRTAGIETYGMIALLTSLSGLVGNFLAFRTNESVVKFYKRGELEESPGLCKLAIGAGLLLDVFVAALLCMIVQTFAIPISGELLKTPEVASGVTVFSWVVLALYLRGTGIGLLTALERFRTIYSLTVLEQTLRLVILMVAIWMGVVLSMENVVRIILVPSLLVTAVIISVPVLRLFRNYIGANIPSGELRKYAGFSLSTFVSSSLKAGNRNIDTLILGYFTSPVSVGVYSLFQRFLSPLLSAISPFHQQIYPKFVDAVGKKELERIRITIVQTNKALLKWSAVLLFSIIPAVVIYWWYMNLEFRIEYMLTFLFMAVSSMILQQLWWARSFALSFNPNISIVANTLSSVLVVSFVVTLTWQLGLVGAALGMLGAGAVMYLYWQSIARRYYRVSEECN